MGLGCQDSNLGMPVPKTGALPLGDTPSGRKVAVVVRVVNANSRRSRMMNLEHLFIGRVHSCEDTRRHEVLERTPIHALFPRLRDTLG